MRTRTFANIMFVLLLIALIGGLLQRPAHAAGPVVPIGTVATATGSGTVSWVLPTQWTNGDPLVVSYVNVYWGLAPGQYNAAVKVPNAAPVPPSAIGLPKTTAAVPILVTADATALPTTIPVYFAVTVVSSLGTPTAPELWESAYSNEVMKPVTINVTQTLPIPVTGVNVALPLKLTCKLAPVAPGGGNGLSCTATSP